ncbi:MAG: hypothetical protein IK143_06865 [Bacteroidales bacterium]|nr:hypothetical protein [Bacteroidales bacterium]
MNKTLKICLEIVLAVAAVGLVYLIYAGVMEPVNFNSEKAAREEVAIQRLKDLRELEVAYKSVNNHYTADFDSLVVFYNTAKMPVVMQIGSMDDSVAVENTNAIKKANKKITDQELLALALKGERIVVAVRTDLPVKDTLFHSRENFCIDSVGIIPFSGGMKVEMDAIVKTVSGVEVPLFEARMPYKALLRGMDHQLIVNLNAERDAQSRYQGLQVGSISAPNNNAGNWE